MIWSDFERAAPALARAARARLEATRVALLGTIRADGSPRISPIEPYFTPDELLLGAMADSLKARDLRRDPRCALHSAISDPDAGDPEFKLYGRAVEIEAADVPAAAWWLSHPRGAAYVFTLDLESAASIAWALEHGEMTVTRWSARSGLVETTRGYP
jgi:hypothetical protein